MEKKKLKFVIIVFVYSLFFSIPYIASGATLGFSPSTISRTVGEVFSINVYVGTPDKSMNAASGVISFPQNIIEVSSVTKASSVMNLWIKEPSFSNSDGKINFEGAVLNPGYKGAQGNIITVVFRAKSAGRADVNFVSGSVLANDGSGTNILEGLGTASFVINVSANEVPVIQSIVNDSGGNAPIIVSTTHSNSANWYTNNTPEFSWNLPQNVLEVRTVIGTSPNGVPKISYVPPISNKKIDKLSDGTYYFSLQTRTVDGWGSIGRFRVNIDTTPPNPFSITFPNGTKGFKSEPLLIFNTTDIGSGISHYDIKIDNNPPVRIESSTLSNPYTLTPQYPGAHVVMVTAVDEAGNTRSASADFIIEAIEAPKISNYQEEIESGDILKIQGTTYPDSLVTIFIKRGDEVVLEESSKSNELGDFTVIIDKDLSPGAYTFTARVTDSHGARSNETEQEDLIVRGVFMIKIVNIILKYLSAVMLIILVLASVIVFGAYLWLYISKTVRRLRREVREAEQVLKKSFNSLRKDIYEHIARLKAVKEKRKLTAEEISFLEDFEKTLDESEDLIIKEMEDVS